MESNVTWVLMSAASGKKPRTMLTTATRAVAVAYPFAQQRCLAKAGAETRVNARERASRVGSPAFNRSIRRGRETNLALSPVEGSGRTGEIYSFVAKSECGCMIVLHVA